jgi:hypothetical protein
LHMDMKLESVFSMAAAIKDAIINQQFLAKKMTHEGREPSTEMSELVQVKQVYDDPREREKDQVVTLLLLAHDLRRYSTISLCRTCPSALSAIDTSRIKDWY